MDDGVLGVVAALAGAAVGGGIGWWVARDQTRTMLRHARGERTLDAFDALRTAHRELGPTLTESAIAKMDQAARRLALASCDSKIGRESAVLVAAVREQLRVRSEFPLPPFIAGYPMPEGRAEALAAREAAQSAVDAAASALESSVAKFTAG